jgi:hypothetical protein
MLQLNGVTYLSWEDYRYAKLDMICTQLDLSEKSRTALRQLEGCDIVLVPDDSGSMQTPLGHQSVQGKSYTRWDEQSKIIRHVIDLGSCLCRDGISLYFLNKGVIRGVTDHSQVDMWLADGPNGATPLCGTLRAIMSERKSQLEERKLLIITLSDGCPNGPGDESVATLERILTKERHLNVYNGFVLMTDQRKDIEHIDEIGDTVKRFDVTDIYPIEMPEVKAARGKDYPFSYGDYIVKMLLGAMDPLNFNLDQRVKNNACCTVQ